MAKFTIATAKKALAAAYPDIEFTYSTAGHGRMRGPSVSWVGGPPPDEIRRAAGAPLSSGYRSAQYHFARQPTAEEWAEQRRQWDEEHRARVAAEPARRAAAKAAGVEKRKATAAAKKAALAKLAEAFPGVEFSLSQGDTAWTDGPEWEAVAAALGDKRGSSYWYQRLRTPESLTREAAEKAVKVHTGRLAKRLAQSKARVIQVARGIERRRTAYFAHLPRLERNPNQFILPMDFPYWEKPPVYLSRVF